MQTRLRTREALLTAEDEVELAKAIEAGLEAEERIRSGEPEPDDHNVAEAGRRAHRRFIEANIRLVLSIAGRWRLPNHVERQDVIQDGLMGLNRAVEKFDWRRGYKFSTYATWWIRQGIQRGMENTGGTIRIPAHRAAEVRQGLIEADGDPNRLPARLAEILALSSCDSTERPIGDGNATLGELTAGDEPGPEDVVAVEARRDAIHDLVATLEPSTAQAVIARFGLDGSEPKTYTAIAADTGVTPEAIRRRIGRALDSLRADAEQIFGDEPKVAVAA